MTEHEYRVELRVTSVIGAASWFHVHIYLKHTTQRHAHTSHIGVKCKHIHVHAIHICIGTCMQLLTDLQKMYACTIQKHRCILHIHTTCITQTHR